MKTGLIIVATFLLIIGLIGLAVRLFFSMSIQDLGLADIDVVCIFTPVICIIFGIVLFILGVKGTDSNITQVSVTQKGDTKDDGMKTLDTRFANEEITKEHYNEIKEEIKK